MCNIIACAADGAPAMVGRHRGFISYLKNVVPEVLAVQCAIHREHLVAKHLSDCLHNSLNIVIKVVKKIKSSALKDRIFRQLCTVARRVEIGTNMMLLNMLIIILF